MRTGISLQATLTCSPSPAYPKEKKPSPNVTIGRGKEASNDNYQTEEAKRNTKKNENP